jgi:multicomponent Na+:H+ antiporter subunit D
MLPLMKRSLTITLDVDWFYRKLGPRATKQAAEFVAVVYRRYEAGGRLRIEGIFAFLTRHAGPHSMAARTPESSFMVLLVVALLGLFLFLPLFVW